MMVDVARYHNIDLFHVHYALPHASVAYLAKQILKTYNLNIPTIVTLHGTDITVVGKDKSYEPVVSFAMNQCEGITAVSESLKKDTYQNFRMRKEIEVIPNFVDIQRFSRQNKDHFRRMLAPNQEKILIHTSNFRKVKRSEEVIQIFSEIQKEIPCKLLMVGDGPERQGAEELCRKLGTCEDVRFLGNQNAVEEIYSIADVFLMPSESESFGLAALEAMSCAVPVVSSNAGGLPEVVKENYNGFVCEVGDVKKMSEKTIFLLKNAEIWRQFSQNARLTAEQYAIHHILPKYEALYEKVLAGEIENGDGRMENCLR